METQLFNKNYPSLVDSSNKFSKIDYSILTKCEKNLIIDGNLIINYDDIIAIYNKCCIYRIQLQFFSIRRKIELLSTLKQISSAHLSYFQKSLNEDYLKKSYKNTEKILSIYNLLQKFKSIISNRDIHNMGSNICQHILSYLTDEYKIYYAPLKNIIDIYQTNNFNKQFILSQLNSIVENIIHDNDPHIECDYCLSINGPTTADIKLDGISSWIFISVDDPIELSYPTNMINEMDLLYASIVDIEKLINIREQYDDTSKLLVYGKNPDNIYISLLYNIGDNYQLPDLTRIILKNKPSTIKYLTTFTKKSDKMHTNDMPKILFNKKNIFPIYTKKKYWLSNFEYSKLSLFMKEKYSLEESRSSIFYIDYVFDIMLNSPVDKKGLLCEDMRDGFMDFMKSRSNI